jgi:hypothetical protein
MFLSVLLVRSRARWIPAIADEPTIGITPQTMGGYSEDNQTKALLRMFSAKSVSTFVSGNRDEICAPAVRMALNYSADAGRSTV